MNVLFEKKNHSWFVGSNIMLRPIMKMTRFGNGLVMGSTGCINYAGLVKTPENLFRT